jgi:hypothetical protein
VFYRSLFVFPPLYCLNFFYLRHLITPLMSSNCSWVKQLDNTSTTYLKFINNVIALKGSRSDSCIGDINGLLYVIVDQYHMSSIWLLISTTWVVYNCWSVPREQYLIVDQYHVSSILLLISTTWAVFDCWSVPREQYLIVDQYHVSSI